MKLSPPGLPLRFLSTDLSSNSPSNFSVSFCDKFSAFPLRCSSPPTPVPPSSNKIELVERSGRGRQMLRMKSKVGIKLRLGPQEFEPRRDMAL